MGSLVEDGKTKPQQKRKREVGRKGRQVMGKLFSGDQSGGATIRGGKCPSFPGKSESQKGHFSNRSEFRRTLIGNDNQGAPKLPSRNVKHRK